MKALLGPIGLLLAGLLAASAPAQSTQPGAENKAAAETATANAPAATNTAPAVKPDVAIPSSAPSVTAEALALLTLDKGAAGTNVDNQSKTNKTAGADEIQVSFQGANIDMIVQWLAQTTGKSVVKNSQVQCQLTIMSSKKVSTREAINLVYRALALEGFTAVESSNSILITPEGKEPKMNPELLDASRKDIPEGRQRLLKIFSLSHIQAAELREKVRGVLSDKGTIDIDERANQLMVTDYNDNLRLLSDLIKEFDVPASGLIIEIRPLKHADADEIANLLGLILNAQAGGASTPSRPISLGSKTICKRWCRQSAPLMSGRPTSAGVSCGRI